MRGKLRFDLLQERASALDMVVGVYLHRRSEMPDEGMVGRVQFRCIGSFDQPLDEQLTTIDDELDYWAKRAAGA